MYNYDLIVFINTYNQKDSIAKAIESVLCQQTAYSFKIIILDDASTDGTSEICKEYEIKYKDKIYHVRQQENTNCLQIHAAYRLIESKYFTFLDGDDYWLGTRKIEKALNILEKNREYTAYCSNGIYHYEEDDIYYEYVENLLHKKFISNKMNFDNFMYVHPASRIYRNIFDFTKEYANLRKRDIYMLYIFLDKGDFYYDKSLTYVYNISPKGIWSGLSIAEKKFAIMYRTFVINKILQYRHNDYFKKEINKTFLNLITSILGKRLGWKIFEKEREKRYLKKFKVNVSKAELKELFNSQKELLRTFNEEETDKIKKIESYIRGEIDEKEQI